MAIADGALRGSVVPSLNFFLHGPVVFAAMLLVPAPSGLPHAAWSVAAVTALMAIFCITEAIPIPATALIPIAAFPLLGIMPSKDASAPLMEKWNLHKRIALHTIRMVGTSPRRMVLGFMIEPG